MSVLPVQVGSWIDAVGGSGFPSSIDNAPGYFAVYNGAWYLFQTYTGAGLGPGQPTVVIYQSLDSGNTWQILDKPHAPTPSVAFFTNAACYYDAPNAQFVVLILEGASFSTGRLSLYAFSLLTGTWSAQSAVSGVINSNGGMAGVFKRPDATVVAVYDAGNPVPGGTTRLLARVWNGVSWSASVDVGTNSLGVLPSGNINVSATIAVMDSTGRIHVVYTSMGGVNYNPGAGTSINPANSIFFYQQFTLANTCPAGLSHQFTGSLANFPGGLATKDDTLVFGVAVGNGYVNAVYVGKSLALPVWSLVSITALNQTPGTAVLDSSPVVASDGSLFVLMATIDQDLVVPTFVKFQLATSTDGVNWTIPAGNSTPTFFYDLGGGSPLPPNVNLQFSVHSISPYLFVVLDPGVPTAFGFAFPYNSSYDTAANGNISLFLGSQQFPQIPAPVPGEPSAIVGGLPAAVSWHLGARGPAVAPVFLGPAVAPVFLGPGFEGPDRLGRQACGRRTIWDDCLAFMEILYRKIKFPPLCAIPPGYESCLPWDDEFGAIPEQSFPLHHTSAIVTPTTASGDNIVVKYGPVPPGYDGIVTGFFWGYSGAGFVQGSGDLIFRIQLNRRFLKDLSNVPYILGSPKFPIPMTEGQLLLSGQTLAIVVNVPNLSGLIQVGASNIFGGLVGFLWPRG